MADIPAELLDPVRAICVALPETYEEAAWTGVRWRIRRRTFAHIFTIDDDSSSVLRRTFGLAGEVTSVTFRVPGEDLLALREAGYPFKLAGWGRDVMAMHLDGRTDWTEVAELLTDSYCLLAPRRLANQVWPPTRP